MKMQVLDYLSKFKCIASNCEATCCANWEVVIDDDSLKKYKNVKGPYKSTLDKQIVKNDENEDIFLLCGDRCSFLNQNNTCDMYINLGKDSLSYTCAMYPRFEETFLNLKEIGLSLSCPEAARMILKEDTPLQLKISDVKDETLSKIDPLEREMLDYFLSTRKLIFKIIEEKNFTFKDKITIILSLVNDVQTKIDLGDTNEIPEVIAFYQTFKNEGFLEEILGFLNEDNLYKNFSIEEKFDYFLSYLNIFKNLKQLKPELSLDLDTISEFVLDHKEAYLNRKLEFKLYYNNDIFKLKNILNYFIFRYFLKGFFDYDIIAKIKFAIISTVMIEKLAYIHWLKYDYLKEEDLVKICYTYSKNVEHLEENVETLEDLFETKDMFIPYYIIQLFD